MSAAKKLETALTKARENVETTRIAWETARASHAKADDGRRGFDPSRDEARIALNDAEADHIDAQDALVAAGRAVADDEHAKAAAAGDPNALVVDLATIACDVRAELEEAARLHALVGAAKSRAAARLQAAVATVQRLTAEAAAAGRPAPPRVPVAYSPYTANGVNTDPTTWLQAIDEALAKGRPAPASSNPGKADKLRNEAMKLRAGLERARREREAAAKAEADTMAHRDSERRRHAEREAKEWAEARAAGAAKIDEERELADAYRARRAAGPSEAA